MTRRRFGLVICLVVLFAVQNNARGQEVPVDLELVLEFAKDSGGFAKAMKRKLTREIGDRSVAANRLK